MDATEGATFKFVAGCVVDVLVVLVVVLGVSYMFSNAVPQTHESNRHIWKDLEESTPELANRRGEFYVITGQFIRLLSE